jgi:hypothetical protein
VRSKEASGHRSEDLEIIERADATERADGMGWLINTFGTSSTLENAMQPVQPHNVWGGGHQRTRRIGAWPPPVACGSQQQFTVHTVGPRGGRQQRSCAALLLRWLHEGGEEGVSGELHATAGGHSSCPLLAVDKKSFIAARLPLGRSAARLPADALCLLPIQKKEGCCTALERWPSGGAAGASLWRSSTTHQVLVCRRTQKAGQCSSCRAPLAPSTMSGQLLRLASLPE